MLPKEYRTISNISGPLMMVESTQDVRYDELAEIELASGERRRGRVLEIESDRALVQVFEGTSGIDTNETKVRFLGKVQTLPVSRGMLGRVFNGRGEPIDGGAPLIAEQTLDINGMPMNPYSRDFPSEFIQTGISTIDGLNPMVRGQKLPIFSGNGLPHNRLAIQIASQAKLMGADNFAVVFAGVGIRHDDAAAFSANLSQRGSKLVMFRNLADDPVIERIATPRYALTAAEYLAFDLGMHVLVIVTDLTSYCEALRELSVGRGEIPSRKGYPAYLYSDLASLYERAGVLKGKEGSITFLPILTMPNDDITNPVPDQTGFITEGQIVLSRALDAAGVYPPIDPLPSLSRLMKDGIGKGYTREDPPSLSSQLFACYSKVQEVKALSEVVGRDELSEEDQAYLAFGDAFERTFIGQSRDENRDIGQSLDRGWRLLAGLPESALTRISLEDRKKYVDPLRDRKAPPTDSV